MAGTGVAGGLRHKEGQGTGVHLQQSGKGFSHACHPGAASHHAGSERIMQVAYSQKAHF
jgi:hypothetical protein